MRPSAAILAVLLLCAAHDSAARDPGAVFYRCGTSHAFTLPGAFGGPVRWSRGPHGQVRTETRPSAEESIYASIEAEADGRLSNPSLRWAQGGRFGPFAHNLGWRSDIFPIHMEIRAGAAVQSAFTRDQLSAVDPDHMEVEISVVAPRALDRPVLISLRRSGIEHAGVLALSGIAQVPTVGRREARVRLHLRDLLALAGGDDRLVVELAEAPRRRHALPIPIAGGTLDLAIVPQVVGHFRAAEAEVRAIAAEAPARCERQVEPEPEPVI